MFLPQHLHSLVLLLLVLLGPLPACVALAAPRRGTAPHGRTHQGLVVLLCWSFLQMALGLLLGVCGRLSLPWVLRSEWLLLLLGLAAWARVRRAGASDSARPVAAPVSRSRGYGAPIAAGVGTLAAALLWVLSAYPTNEWDSLAYHLPAMAQWYQSGHLVRLPHDPLLTGCYPYGWELVCSLFLFPLRGDLLVALPNLLAWLLLGLSIYCLATELGASRTAGAASAALVLSLPYLLFNVNTLHVDLAFAAFLTASVYLAVLHARTRERAHVLLALVGLALACGTKTTGLLYGLPALLLLALLPRGRGAATTSPARRGHPLRSLPVLLAIAGVCFAGSFWYLRNWAEFGNPLAPARVALGQRVIFPGGLEAGHLRRGMLVHVFRLADPRDWQVLTTDLYRFYGLPFVALLIGAGLSLPALTTRRTRASRGRALLALAWVGATALCYSLTPVSGDDGTHQWRLTPGYTGSETRLAFSFFAAVGVLAALGATVARVPNAVLAAVALSSVLLALADMRLLVLVIPGLVGWGALRLLAARCRVLFSRRWVGAVALALLGAVLVVALQAASDRRAIHRQAIYGPMVEYLTTRVPATRALGYLLCPHSYLLYGPHLDRRVVYLPLRSLDRGEWRRALRARRLDLVAMGPDGGVWSDSERELAAWLEGPDGPLVRLFAGGDGRPTLYGLKPGAFADPLPSRAPSASAIPLSPHHRTDRPYLRPPRHHATAVVSVVQTASARSSRPCFRTSR